MQIKYIEIRDEMTCIAAVAMRMVPSMDAAVPLNTEIERRFMRREGYPETGTPSVILMRLGNQEASVDPYGWKGNTRTIPQAHHFIIEHWDEIKNGDVVDVRVVLGEATTAAIAEIWS